MTESSVRLEEWLGVKVWLEVEVELAEVLAERLGAGLMEHVY